MEQRFGIHEMVTPLHHDRDTDRDTRHMGGMRGQRLPYHWIDTT